MPTDRLTLFIDADRYRTPRALHDALQRLLALPAHYGHNADALYDCLAGRKTPVNVKVVSAGEGETAAALRKCLCVFEDLGGEIR